MTALKEDPKVVLKKTLLGEMIKLKHVETKTDLRDFIQIIEAAEDVELGSSIKLFQGETKLWKSELLEKIYPHMPEVVGEKGSSNRDMCSKIISGWATTTRVEKNKNSGKQDYVKVLNLVKEALKKDISDDDAIEDAIQGNQATLPQEPQEEAGTLVVQGGPAARPPSPRHLSPPRHALAPGPPTPMTLGSHYNYHDGGSDLHTFSVDGMTDEEFKDYLSLLASKSKEKVDANNTSYETYCRANKTSYETHCRYLSTERDVVKKQNDAAIQKAEDEAKQLLLSRSAHRHRRLR